MHIRVFTTAHAAAFALGKLIATTARSRPRLVVGLPTGRTPIPLYEALVDLSRRGRIDWSRIETFNLDEFVGIPADHPGSYRSFMQRHLFDHIGGRARRHLLNGAARDTRAECVRYERAIARAGGIDVQILGIGTNGHIGFNEPGPILQARTHRVTMRPETRRSNAALFDGNVGAVPQEALSMGMATILQARSIVLLATGQSKASCVARLLGGPITTELPASFLQLHSAVDVVVDAAAASAIPGAVSEH